MSDTIPGQLKAVVINLKLSIAYAGLVHRSVDVIRRIYELASEGAVPQELLDELRLATKDGQCEFLIASHNPEAQLRKVANGAITDPVKEAWIGNSAAVGLIQNVMTTRPGVDCQHASAEESKFTSAFLQIFSNRGVHLTNNVGGIPIQLLCSPNGHCYSGSISAVSWDTINLGTGLRPQQIADRKSGYTSWHVHCCDPVYRGVGVVGVYFDQISVGYIYDPIHADQPQKVSQISYRDFQSRLRDFAGRKPGATLVD